MPVDSGDKAAVLLVGAGQMGMALVRGWLEAGTCSSITIVEPNPAAAILDRDLVQRVAQPQDLPDGFQPDIIALAVKPQLVPAVAPLYRQHVRAGACLLSIVAGKTIAGLEGIFGREAAIVRAMPNTPAAIGQGVTICCANNAVSADQKQLAERLISAVGVAGWVDQESLIDAVTAVSGSGPAYVFLLVEVLAQAGVAAGLPVELAMMLARKTVSGTGALLAGSPETPETLRRNVTSPHGTTQAALDVLTASDGLQSLITKAVLAATRRSHELAG